MSDMKDQYQPDDLTKLQFEHAWRWFDGHAKQRAAIFSYFLIITGILMNALVREASSEFPVAFPDNALGVEEPLAVKFGITAVGPVGRHTAL